MSILTPPLSKRGILKALGQDPSKSDVLTVSTNLSGVIKPIGLQSSSDCFLNLGILGDRRAVMANVPQWHFMIIANALAGSPYRIAHYGGVGGNI